MPNAEGPPTTEWTLPKSGRAQLALAYLVVCVLLCGCLVSDARSRASVHGHSQRLQAPRGGGDRHSCLRAQRGTCTLDDGKVLFENVGIGLVPGRTIPWKGVWHFMSLWCTHGSIQPAGRLSDRIGPACCKIWCSRYHVPV